MSFNRREFLKTVAIGGAGMLTANELTEFLAQATERGPLPAREGQRWALGVCGLCPGGCGLLGRIVGEKLVSLRGAPFHPLSRGGLCPRGSAGTQLLYHPKRLLSPLKRSAGRGEGKFQSISWDQALGEISARLGQGQVMMVTPRTRAQLAGLRRATLPDAAFVEHRPYHEVASPDPALFMCQGIWGHPAYDLGNTDLILSFNSGLLERFWHPCETLRGYSRARTSRGCRLIHVESRRSITGDKADEWVPVYPGMEATLALGIAHVLIKEGLINRAFLADQTFGFDDFKDAQGNSHQGFRSMVLSRFDPRTVSDATSVPIELLIRVARRFAGARRAVAIGCDLPGVQGPHTKMAIHCLNALVGNIERSGGVLIPQAVTADPFKLPARADAARGDARSVLAGPAGPDAETVLAGLSKGPSTLIISEADVIGEAVDRERVKRAISTAGFVVAMDALPSETVDHADLVLPLATYLERYNDVWHHTSEGYPLISLGAPLLKPLGKSRSEADVLFALAGRVGRKLPLTSYEAVLKSALKEVYATRKGQIFGIEHNEAWLQALERSGWEPPRPTDFESFYKGALEVGGWWDPVYYHQEWQRALKTPSGKFEFHSQGLRTRLKALGGAEPGDLDVLPHPERVKAPSKRFPLALQLYTPPTVGGRAGQLSWLRSIAGAYFNMEWYTWVELNPLTASQLGLKAGARAKIHSKHGSIVAVVVHSKATPPDTAVIPCGILATDTDPRPGANPLVLLGPDVEPLTGHQRRNAGRVAIAPG